MSRLGEVCVYPRRAHRLWEGTLQLSTGTGAQTAVERGFWCLCIMADDPKETGVEKQDQTAIPCQTNTRLLFPP